VKTYETIEQLQEQAAWFALKAMRTHRVRDQEKAAKFARRARQSYEAHHLTKEASDGQPCTR
jgi:hypothetical protein